jgi:hypothetical protein
VTSRVSSGARAEGRGEQEQERQVNTMTCHYRIAWLLLTQGVQDFKSIACDNLPIMTRGGRTPPVEAV